MRATRVKNFKLIIEYDGTEFHGWQKQPEVRTVQNVLEGVLAELFRETVDVAGCCRTDAGVHALGFVGSFEVRTALVAEQIRGALNARLPDDVVVRWVEEAAPDFHARHSCIARRYVYKISTVRPAVLRHVLAYTRYGLDTGRMAEAAKFLVGRKDFASFAPRAIGDEFPTICGVESAAVAREDTVVSFEIKADRFLHHMVRNIAGTLIEVGRGRFDPEHIEEIMRKKDRTAAGPTAPACGLSLVEAYYPEGGGA
jgi:tRNA pseudouridine38-40 synthase